MFPVILKISKKEAFSSNDILLDFLRDKCVCVCVCVCGGGGGGGQNIIPKYIDPPLEFSRQSLMNPLNNVKCFLLSCKPTKKSILIK